MKNAQKQLHGHLPRQGGTNQIRNAKGNLKMPPEAFLAQTIGRTKADFKVVAEHVHKVSG